MVKAKHIIVILFVTMPLKALAASAWLPKKHKYSISLLNTDETSITLKNERIQFHQKIENIIEEKYNKRFWLNIRKQQLKDLLSTLHRKRSNVNSVNNIRQEANISQELYYIEVAEKKILDEVEHLKLLLPNLNNYNQEQFFLLH